MTLSLERFFLAWSDNIRREFFHRGTRADKGVLQQQFTNQDYALGRLRRGAELNGLYTSIVQSDRVPLIIDAGANIGASAVWFSLQYPQAQIVCFEPDAANFKLLEMNTSGLPVDLYQAAVGSVDGAVDLYDPGEGEWGYRTKANVVGATRLLSLDRMVCAKEQENIVPFIVKIDIEGGEDDLFAQNTDWIDRFPLIIIELHDWLLPGERTSANFLRAVSQRNRDFVHIGENIFSIRN